MLQKILVKLYKQSFGPLNLNSCYSNDYSFSVSSQYFPQVAGQTILPCTTQLILTKDFIKSFVKLLTKNFTMSIRHNEKIHKNQCSV